MTRELPPTPAAADGSTDSGRNRFVFSAWFFLRLLALVHFIAFTSAWTQLAGLVGPHGVLPAPPFFDAVLRQLGPAEAHAQLPSLCWLFGAGKFLSVLCAIGTALSVLLFAGIAPVLCLLALWACYLSLCGAGQTFFNFQWDALLLETTLLAVWLAPWSLRPFWRAQAPPRVARWLLVWLLFRLMFLSGAVKLASGDPLWHGLTALTVHYETQPLPTPLAWYAHQLPAWFQRLACGAMFAIELGLPFFLFAPRRARHAAALLTAGLMLLIALTGNYTFFNLLTVSLCLLCLDDAFWSPLLRRVAPKKCHVFRDTLLGAPRWQRWPLGVFAAFVFTFTALQLLPVLSRRAVQPPGFATVAELVAPLRSFNTYGLFAVMTPTRPELIFEGSADGRTWLPYAFPHQPGDLARRPTWIAPFQPRLDWQLWFAALGPIEQNRWVLSLCEHLLRGTPDVLALLATNPFPAQPPRFVRVIRYNYHFTTAAEHARTGNWWRRDLQDVYLPPASLR